MKSTLSRKIFENESNFLKIRPLAAQFSMRRHDGTVSFRNFANAPKMHMTRECSTHDIANVHGYTQDNHPFRRANARLIRYPTFTNQSTPKDHAVIQIKAVRRSVPCFLKVKVKVKFTI
jgi:hypothetical protein